MSGIDQSCLLGDIGGTHARFCLYTPRTRGFSNEQVQATGDFAGPAEAIGAFLESVEVRPRRAALSVAAPVLADRVRFTNERWGFSIVSLRAALGLDELVVVNDFSAQAMALPRLASSDYLAIGGGEPRPGGAIGVLGPGTGLGVAGLVRAGNRWPPVPGEGGHVTLAAATPRQDQVVACLRRAHGHVSAERVLSGQGLVTLYDALCRLAGRTPQTMSPAEVTRRASDGSCPVCAETLACFFQFLGNVAGNLALTLGATGGVYLAGGILPRLPDALRASGFRAAFVAKGRFEGYLEKIPTRLIRRPNPAFLGLAAALDEVEA